MSIDQLSITTDYDRLRESTLRGLSAKLRGRRIHLDPADLEDFYNEAWHALYVKLGEGDPVDNPAGFLVQVAYFRAIDEYRRLHPDRRDDEAQIEAAAVEVDVDSRIDADRDLRAFTEGIRGELDEREGQAAVLCYLHGLSRPEAARVLGLNDSRMQKLMDGVSKKLGPVVESLRSGNWCETRESLVKAYAVGLLDPDGERYKLAVSHLRECSGCRRRVLGMRGLAAAVPPVAVPWTLVQSGGGAPAAMAGRGDRSVRHAALAAAGAAAVAVAAAVAITQTGDDGRPAAPEPQAQQQAGGAAAAATSAPAARARPTAAERAEARRAARQQTRRRRRRAQPTPPAPAAVVTSAPTVAPPVVTSAPVEPPAAAPAPTVTKDAGEEFGFEP